MCGTAHDWRGGRRIILGLSTFKTLLRADLTVSLGCTALESDIGTFFAVWRFTPWSFTGRMPPVVLDSRMIELAASRRGEASLRFEQRGRKSTFPFSSMVEKSEADPYYVADPPPEVRSGRTRGKNGAHEVPVFGGIRSMSCILLRRAAVKALAFLALASIALTACGGGGGGAGGGGQQVAQVADTSFQGHPIVGGGGLVPVLLDEALEITFGGPIDAGIFGGFFTELGATTPTVFTAGRPGNLMTVPVPYFAYNDQVGARNALMIFDDVGSGIISHPGLIGRHATRPDVIVFDPNVTPNITAIFGGSISQGFIPNRQYDVFIPAASGLLVGGQSVATFGSRPPQTIPAPTISPQVSTLFMTGAGFLPRSAPEVVEVTSMTLDLVGGNPAIDAIPFDDVLIVRFSQAVDPTTVNAQVNIVTQNTDVVNTQQPNGIVVPSTITFDATLTEMRITPAPHFGGGPFQIRVRITKFDPDDATVAGNNILGLPQGGAAEQLPLEGTVPMGNQSVVVSETIFMTIMEPGVPVVSSITEGFDNTMQLDADFVGEFNNAEWAGIDMTTLLPTSQLRALTIDGTPFAPDLGFLAVGMRRQFSINCPGTPNSGNPFCTTAKCSYSSPFDDNLINNGLNPNGGSHLQLVYLTINGSAELPIGTRDAFELVEWTPANLTASPVTYNGFTLRCGATSANPTGGTNPQALVGLTTTYNDNFDMDNPQNEWIQPFSHPSLAGLPANESPITVFGPAPFTVSTLNGVFIPYPRFPFGFDYNDDVMEPQMTTGINIRPNVIFDFEVPAPHITDPVTMFVNVSIGTNEVIPTPFRRAIGAPGASNAIAIDAVKYDARLTLAKKNSSVESAPYDTGQLDPSFTAFDVSPAVSSRPPNTRIKVDLRSSDVIADGDVSGSYATYIDLNGVIDPSVLTGLAGGQFLQARISFEADLLTNTVPFLDGFVIGYSFF